MKNKQTKSEKKVYRLKLGAVAKAKRAEIRKSTGSNQFDDLAGWVSFFKEHKRLPSQKITCAHCKKNQTSCFGDNARRWLAKFDNNIEALLSKFECSECRKPKQPAKEAKQVKVPKGNKGKAGDINVSGNTTEDYITREDMEDRKDKVRATLPQMDPDAKPINIDLSDPEAVAELTTGACQRPDIYLDAGCFHCSLVKHCKAQCRVPDRSLDKGDRVKRSTGPKRK